MKWCISDDEDDLLQGLTMGAQLIYLRCLRRYMDFSTGITGQSRRISRRMLIEVLEYRPPSSSTKPVSQLTQTQIRSHLKELDRVGLIRSVKIDQKALPLVFLLPLAVIGEIRPKTEEPMKNRIKNRNSEVSRTEQTRENTWSVAESGTELKDPEEPRVDAIKNLHLDTGNKYKNTHTTRARVIAGDFGFKQKTTNPAIEPEPDEPPHIPDKPKPRKFQMHQDWTPDDEVLTFESYQQGVKARITPEEIAEFRCYWQDEQKELTERQWTGRLITHIKQQRSRQTGGGAQHATNSTGYQHGKGTRASRKKTAYAQATYCASDARRDEHEFEEYRPPAPDPRAGSIETTWETVD